MAALDGSYDAGVVTAQGTRDAQVGDVAARIERLPLTSYQRGIFAILATAWFFASVDLGALTFDRGSTTQPFQLSTAEAGLLSSISFFGMFIGTGAFVPNLSSQNRSGRNGKQLEH
jgi:putative MFS transporter